MNYGERSDLRELMRQALAERLAVAGWRLDPNFREDRDLGLVAAFIRPLNAEFAASADFACDIGWRRSGSLAITRVAMAVAYEPLRRLWPLLGDLVRLSILGEVVAESPDRLGRPFEEVSGAGEVAEAADRLVGPVLARGVAFAERYASVDALLAEFRGELLEPAIMAAAGRLQEAREALDADHRPPLIDRREEARFVRQLRRWVDSDGDPSLIPAKPPPPAFLLPQPPSMGRGVDEGLARAAALRSVRRSAAGKSRDQLHAMLVQELAEREVHESPLWLARALDRIQASPQADTAPDWKKLGELAWSAMKWLRNPSIPKLDAPPEFVEPPERAAYTMPSGGVARWRQVTLDPDKRSWLDRVHREVPHFGETVNVDAWLQPAAHEPQGSLSVHLGPERVGILDAANAVPYQPVMEDAAARDELPCLKARLTPRPDPQGYLLELALPPEPDTIT